MIEIKKIKPEVLWYLIGYISTDGNLNKDGRHIVITSKDLEHLEKIKKVAYISNKITIKKNSYSDKKYYDLPICNVIFYRYLLSIGLTPRKSKTLGIIKINKKYFADFLRGVIDGDGCLYSWKNNSNDHIQWSLSIIGIATNFINWLRKEIEDVYKVNGKIHTYQDKRSSIREPVHIIRFGKISAQKILEKVYYKNCFCLDRKLVIVKRCLLDKKKMLD
ncbi:MAG: LAGLIDADG family homing endonuclease [bacterium]|nr:LAGLIDADG family homing endonuclease [bacterium]